MKSAVRECETLGDTNGMAVKGGIMNAGDSDLHNESLQKIGVLLVT